MKFITGPIGQLIAIACLLAGPSVLRSYLAETIAKDAINDRIVCAGSDNSAIAACTRVLGEANLAIDTRASALSNRAAALIRQGETTKAIADATKAIEINPNWAPAYILRGQVHRRDGDEAAALPDFDKAVELAPGNPTYLYARGLSKFNLGAFKAAAADFLPSAIAGKNLHPALLHFLARSRAGEPARSNLEETVTGSNAMLWPYAVAELYLGKRSIEATLDAASGVEQRCEAQFFIGEWHVLANRRSSADEAFADVLATCPKHSNEYLAAIAERNRDNH